MEGAERQTGTVKWFNPSKGYGFIAADQGGDELFVHQSNIKSEGFRSLREGEIVEFEVEAGTDGRAKAINVTGPEGATPQGTPSRPGVRIGGGRGGGHQPGFNPSNFYGYPPMPQPFYFGYYFPPDLAGRGGRGGRGGGRGMPPGPMYFPGPPPGMGGVPPPQMHQQLPPSQSSGLQVVVHNLPWSCTWQQLKDHFKDYNVERADIVLDQYGRSRGFGTIRFTRPEDAETACLTMNNSRIEDRSISVRIDRYA